MIQCVWGVAACVALVWHRFFGVQRGSPLCLRRRRTNKTGSNTTNTSDVKAQTRTIIINDFVLQGCVLFVTCHEHYRDFVFSAEWPRNFCPVLYTDKTRWNQKEIFCSRPESNHQPRARRATMRADGGTAGGGAGTVHAGCSACTHAGAGTASHGATCKTESRQN